MYNTNPRSINVAGRLYRKLNTEALTRAISKNNESIIHATFFYPERKTSKSGLNIYSCVSTERYQLLVIH